jgi:hypothetical protein
MKRLLGLVVLLVVLCMSVPSYGYYLIYNLSGSAKGINNGVPASIPWKGYFVVKVSGSSILDANLIMYGKDSAKAKVYVEFDKDATGVTKLTATPDELGSFPNIYLTIDIKCETADFDFEGLTVGSKAVLLDIGSGGLQGVSKGAKGTLIVRQGRLLKSTDDVTGTGTISTSLWLPATKYVNQNNWTQDQIINAGDIHQKSLTQILEGKGFTDATP